MDDVKAVTAEWGEAVYNARENWTVSPHEHIERLITVGDALQAALAAPRPQPDESAKTEEMAEWGDAVAAIAGCPGAPPAEAFDRLVKAGDALQARIGVMTLARMLHVCAAPRPSVELQNIAMAARRGLAFGHQATPQTAERMVERKDEALRAVLSYCERAGVSSSVLRESVKQERCRVGASMADDYSQHAAECPECLAYDARPSGKCGAVNAPTGARCTLPAGHAENHHGAFSQGTAQWPSGEREAPDLVALVTEWQAAVRAHKSGTHMTAEDRADSWGHAMFCADKLLAWRPSPPGERPSEKAMSEPTQRKVCTKDAPMPQGDKGYWQHPEATLDFEEYNGLAGGGDYEHYICPNCKKGFYVELPD